MERLETARYQPFLSIETVHKCFVLLSMANATPYLLLKDLAKELKIPKTTLMQFVLDNPKLIIGKPPRKASNGYVITNVYLNAVDNPLTDEWLEKKINDNNKYLHISEYNNYGHIAGYYISVDDPETKDGKWRNTKEKFDTVRKFLNLTKPAGYWVGGLGDSSYCSPSGTEISDEGLKLLAEDGWTFNKFADCDDVARFGKTKTN